MALPRGEGVSEYQPPTLIDSDCNCIDLVLVIDDTGSMFGAIANVAAGIEDIIDLADSTCGSVQAALVTFSDTVEVDEDLTFNVAAVKTAVGNLIATGGVGIPEASDEALREVLTEPGTICTKIGDFTTGAFRDTCCRVVVLVTDAQPGGCDDFYDAGVDMPNAHDRALEAAAAGIQIGALFVPTFGDPGDIVTIMTDYAGTSGGVYGQTAADGNGTAAAIEQLILDCIGQAQTELCCIPDAHQCVEVLAGQCDALGGYVVSDCSECEFTGTESSSWGTVKKLFRD
ncbi:MAG: vWA domain-containing protein [Candidatus Eisenbacteria bacterium]